jgi:hypothetical protein
MLPTRLDERIRRKQIAKATTRQAIARTRRLIAGSKERIARSKARDAKKKKARKEVA